MRVSLTLLVLAACVALCAGAACSAQITAKARDGASWYVGAVHYQIWDITVTNTGSCILTSIVGVFTPKEDCGFISQTWNWDAPSGVFSGYGSLAIGQSFYGAGFVLADASMPVLGLTRVGCPDSCPQATTTTTAPTTTKAPTTTTAPTTTKAPTTTMAPTTTTAPTTTKAPTTTMAPTTTAPSSCRVAVSIARDSNWWLDQGRNTSVYRITMTNYGPCSLLSYVVAINIYSGTVISYWNLVSVLGGYAVTGYGPYLASGSTFTAAGLIIAGAPDVLTISQYSSSCGC